MVMALDLLSQLACVAGASAFVVLALSVSYSLLVLWREGVDGLRNEWRDTDAASHLAQRYRLGPRERMSITDLQEYRKARR